MADALVLGTGSSECGFESLRPHDASAHGGATTSASIENAVSSHLAMETDSTDFCELGSSQLVGVPCPRPLPTSASPHVSWNALTRAASPKPSRSKKPPFPTRSKDATWWEKPSPARAR